MNKQNSDNQSSSEIIIFDTTLRDGEQSPGASMTLDEKLVIAQTLDQMGVQVIEAGFPAASVGDFKSVEKISGILKNATVAGLARARMQDIEAAGEAIKKAKRKRIHTFISTSPLHMKHKLNMEPEQVLEAITASVQKACQYTDDVEWSCEDGTRSEPDFLLRAIDRAIQAGATTINVPDTVGYTTPNEYADLIGYIRANVVNIDKAIISTHCHNDLGLAVANSLAAVQAGARQIECTINGLGERAGNAAMEEVVMALRTRRDILPFHTNVDPRYFHRISHLVSSVTGFMVQYNKAIVGKNAFAHESGIHQDGMLKHSGTYEIMNPEDVGLTKSQMVLGKLSGRHAFADKLQEMGILLADDDFQEAFQSFKLLADRKRHIYDADIIALIDDITGNCEEVLSLISLIVIAGTETQQRAILTLSINGEKHEVTAQGDGPVDALFKAIRRLYPHDAQLELYQVQAVTGGTDAQAQVNVRLTQDGLIASGQASATDTLVASTKAYLYALNRLMTKIKLKQ